MLTFKKFLTEDQLKHLVHIEDSLLDLGLSGYKNAIYQLISIKNMLTGSGKSSGRTSLSIKYDGSPSLICGYNPENNKFFVATKSAWSKSPKLCYSKDDVINYYPAGGLTEKLLYALKYLPTIGIKGVIQGDFLYTKPDLSIETIDNEQYVCFTPNTLTYAVLKDSEYGKNILKSHMGIIFHTAYSGKSMSTLSATFNVKFNFRSSNYVWMPKSEVIKDVSGVCTLSSSELDTCNTYITNCIKYYKELDRTALESLFDSKEILSAIRTFNNKMIRDGITINSPSKTVDALQSYIHDLFLEKQAGLKTDKGRMNSELKYQQKINKFNSIRKTLITMYMLQNEMVLVKNLLMNKLNKINQLSSFIKSDDGFKVSSGEGLVCTDVLNGSVFKLVDRLEFSRNNFAISSNRRK